jgi:hypothetical protein
MVTLNSTATLTNNTISLNELEFISSKGGGIAALFGASCTGINNIIYGNIANQEPEVTVELGSISLNYSCSSQSLAGTGNITDNPNFVNPTADDFYLQQGSLCIDSGDPTSPLDPDTTRADMGAIFFDQSAVGITETQSAVPKQYFMFPAYPNPFNPSTTIRYQLPQAADVKLEIFNTLGQTVHTLVNSRVEAGYHEVRWNGRDDSGIQMPSGVYMYRIEAKDFQQVKKMLLMK